MYVLYGLPSTVYTLERNRCQKIMRSGYTVSDSNERCTLRKSATKEKSTQEVINRKLHLFGRVCRMGESTKIELLIFGQK